MLFPVFHSFTFNMPHKVKGLFRILVRSKRLRVSIMLHFFVLNVHENFIIFVSRINMAETEVAPTRPPELITITVIRARNLVSWIKRQVLSSADYLCKHFRPRSGPTNC